jgi:hypothetical protein
MEFIDEGGCIIVPRSVRPIIDSPQTIFGNGNGALRQFRFGKLHVREYPDHYSVHSDKIDPMKDPLGHLMMDAPEYLAGILFGLATYSYLKNKPPNYLKKDNRKSNFRHDRGGTASSPFLATLLAAFCGYGITKSLKKLSQQG